MASINSDEFFDTAIKAAIQTRLEAVVAEETAKAKVAVGDRMRAELWQIVVKLFDRFSIERNQCELVIRVSNEIKGGQNG